MNVNELVFEPNCPPEVIEAAKNWFIAKKGSFKSTTNFAVFATDGFYNEYLKQICHRRIREDDLIDRCLVATEIGIHRRANEVDRIRGAGSFENSGSMTWDTALPFLNWFLYESYVGRFILNRDDVDFVKQYGILVSADIPAPILQNAMIISRHFLEAKEDSFIQFKKLLDNGVNGNIAYALCFNSTYSIPGSKLNTTVRTCTGHRAHPLWCLGAFRNFLVGELGDASPAIKKIEAGKTYRTDHDYSGGWRLFFNVNNDIGLFGTTTDYRHFIYDLVALPEFREALSSRRKSVGKEVMYHPPNPFKPPEPGTRDTPNSDEVSNTELFEFVGPWLHNYFVKEGLINAEGN